MKENNSTISGSDIIKDFALRLPTKPGIYQMIGEGEKVLYVGKAKDLKSRVTSYTRKNGLNNRIMRMVSLTVKMDFTTTRTEAEAFLLEADLIKSLKPHFNILLKDDKTYPYLLIRKDHDYSQIIKHRGVKSTKGKYFGPFASSGSVNQTMEILQKAFLLRTCSDSVFSNRSRPCLLHQIKRCSAPCTNEISHQDYLDTVKMAESFLNGKGKSIIKQLSEQMYESSGNMEYEKAANYRDRLKALSNVAGKENFHPNSFSNADIIGLYNENDMNAIQIKFIRSGQNWGSSSYFPRSQKDVESSELINGFLGQFYQNKPCPDLILLSHETEGKQVLQNALGDKYDVSLSIEVPKKGEKYKFVQEAVQNAKEALMKKQLETGKQTDLINKLANLLEIDTPNRIEVYDNAHISGSHALGAMIVANAEGFDKKQYRSWNIKNKDIIDGDDYAMMHEVLSRRFKKILDGDKFIADLIILDGGAGQLSVVTKLAEEYGIDIPIIAVAKGEDRNAGRERFYLKNKEAFTLASDDPVLYFVQRLRDEAHRFANGTHSKKRDKLTSQSPLDEIEGVGLSRKKALKAKFGSVRAIKEANLNEIEQTPSISKTLAKKIYDHFCIK